MFLTNLLMYVRLQTGQPMLWLWGHGSKVQIGIEGLQEDNEGMNLNGVMRS